MIYIYLIEDLMILEMIHILTPINLIKKRQCSSPLKKGKAKLAVNVTTASKWNLLLSIQIFVLNDDRYSGE